MWITPYRLAIVAAILTLSVPSISANFTMTKNMLCKEYHHRDTDHFEPLAIVSLNSAWVPSDKEMYYESTPFKGGYLDTGIQVEPQTIDGQRTAIQQQAWWGDGNTLPEEVLVFEWIDKHTSKGTSYWLNTVLETSWCYLPREKVPFNIDDLKWVVVYRKT